MLCLVLVQMADNSDLFFKTYEVFNLIQTEYPKVLDNIFLYQKMFGAEDNTFHYSERIKDKESFLRINENLLNALKDFDVFFDTSHNP
jgi:hypothetical protein